MFELVLTCWLCGRLVIGGFATAELCRWSGEMAVAYFGLERERVHVRCRPTVRRG